MIPLGSRILLSGSFKGPQGMLDPPRVVVTIRGRTGRTTASTDDEVARESRGVYTLEYVVDEVGALIVRFEASTGEFGEQRFDVSLDGAMVMDEADADLELDEPAEESSGRSAMIAELRAMGIAVDESRSDAFIEGFYEDHMRRRRDASHGEYVRRVRGG